MMKWRVTKIVVSIKHVLKPQPQCWSSARCPVWKLSLVLKHQHRGFLIGKHSLTLRPNLLLFRLAQGTQYPLGLPACHVFYKQRYLSGKTQLSLGNGAVDTHTWGRRRCRTTSSVPLLRTKTGEDGCGGLLHLAQGHHCIKNQSM